MHSYASFLVATLMLIGISCSSSEKATPNYEPVSEKHSVKTETKAAIVGGMQALYRQLSYPAQAKKNGIEATLEANVLITQKGEVDQVTFNGQPRSDFQQAAENALRSVTFRAGQRNGEAVNMYITIPIAFRL
ncbi:MAG: energy transducer TonB [Fodinibius sp.]|nr:energy transducer TonB [Fodinibius sp.]